MERHNSCLNTLAIINYIDRHYGPAPDLLEGLAPHLPGVDNPLEFLKNQNNWVSSTVCRQLYDNARRISGDSEVAFKIGFESVTGRKFGYVQNIMLRSWGSPSKAIERLRAVNDKFNRNKEVEVIKVSDNEVCVRLHWYKNFDLTRDFCLYNLGMYAASPTIWGLPPAKVTHPVCFFQGGGFCEYHITWQAPSLRQRLGSMFQGRRGLLADTLSELERDKHLLQQKHSEVVSLNLSLQHKIDQLISIQRASGAILAELDYRRLYPTVLKLFIKAIGYNRGMIMLVDEQRGVLRYVEGVGARPEELGVMQSYELPLTRHNNLLVQVVLSAQPLVCEDTSALNLNPENLIIRNYHPGSIVILPLTAQGKVIGLLAADRQRPRAPQVKPDGDYLNVFANQVALAIENARMYRDLRESFISTVQSLAQALEAKDHYTRGHSDRVTQYALRLGDRLALPEVCLDQIRRVAVLHDIGKIGVDRGILHKPGPLLSAEREAIRQHPLLGQGIIAPLNLSKEEVAIVRHHHEHMDGSGYPDGLTGDQLPMQVRVVAVADVFDAMTTDRPYRRALQVEEALGIIKDGSGRQFDPLVVEALVDMVGRGELQDLLVRRTPPLIVNLN